MSRWHLVKIIHGRHLADANLSLEQVQLNVCHELVPGYKFLTAHKAEVGCVHSGRCGCWLDVLHEADSWDRFLQSNLYTVNIVYKTVLLFLYTWSLFFRASCWCCCVSVSIIWFCKSMWATSLSSMISTFVVPFITLLMICSWCQYWKEHAMLNHIYIFISRILNTSKWLLACPDHSSRVENIRPHNSHDQDNCWCCGIFSVAIDEPPEWCDCKWLFMLWDTLMLASNMVGLWSIDDLLFSLFSSFFFVSDNVWLRRLPKGAMFVGVTCLNLFIWITSLSRRANALLQTCRREEIRSKPYHNTFYLGNMLRKCYIPRKRKASRRCGFACEWSVCLFVQVPFHKLYIRTLCVWLKKQTKSCEHIFKPSKCWLYLLFDGVVFRIPWDACCTCCRAFNRLAGCIEPPSTYGSVNGIRLGRGTLCWISGVQLPRLWSTRTPPS